MAPPHAPSKMTGGICETRERAQRQRKVRRRQQQRREQRSPPGHWRPAGQSVTGSGAVSPGGWGEAAERAARSHSGSAAKVSFWADTTCPRPASRRSSAHTPHYGPVPASFSFRRHTCTVANGSVRRRKHAPARQASAPLWPRHPAHVNWAWPDLRGRGEYPPRPPTGRDSDSDGLATSSPPAPTVSECHSPGPARDEQQGRTPTPLPHPPQPGWAAFPKPPAPRTKQDQTPFSRETGSERFQLWERQGQ